MAGVSGVARCRSPAAFALSASLLSSLTSCVFSQTYRRTGGIRNSVDAQGGMTFDTRAMSVDFGLAWLGDWGYLGALVWIPTALTRAVLAWRRGRGSAASERILFLTLCSLMLATWRLMHLTPLRYPSY